MRYPVIALTTLIPLTLGGCSWTQNLIDETFDVNKHAIYQSSPTERPHAHYGMDNRQQLIPSDERPDILNTNNDETQAPAPVAGMPLQAPGQVQSGYQQPQLQQQQPAPAGMLPMGQEQQWLQELPSDSVYRRVLQQQPTAAAPMYQYQQPQQAATYGQQQQPSYPQQGYQLPAARPTPGFRQDGTPPPAAGQLVTGPRNYDSTYAARADWGLSSNSINQIDNALNTLEAGDRTNWYDRGKQYQFRVDTYPSMSANGQQACRSGVLIYKEGNETNWTTQNGTFCRGKRSSKWALSN